MNTLSLLAALESHNVAVEYQCREGYCGSCRTRLVAGQVDWIAEPLAFIQPGKFCPVVAGQKAILKSRCELSFNARYDAYTSYLAYNDYIA